MALCVLALSFSGSSRAEPDAAAKETAHTLMSKGRALRKQNDLKGALEAFRSADAIMHVPTTGIEVARSQAALGLFVDARETARLVSRLPEAPDESPAFKVARLAATELDQQLASKIATLALSFPGLGPGVVPKVFADDLEIPPAAFGSYRLNPGKHELVAKLGEEASRRSVTLAEGETKQVEFDLAPPQKTESSSPAPAESKPFSADLGRDLDGPKSIPSMVYVLAATSIVGFAAGTTMGLMGRHNKAHLEESCAPNCSDASVSQIQTMYTAANISFVIGAASALTSIIWYSAVPSTRTPLRIGQGGQGPRFTFGVQPEAGAARFELRGSF